MGQLPKLAAIAVVIHQDHVLLVKRKNPPDAGLWGFPGGHVDWGETSLAAAVRELREETGVIAKPRDYLTNIDVIREDPSGDGGFHFLLAAVLCDYISGTPQARDDVSDARWIKMDDLMAGRLACSQHVDDVAALARSRLTSPD